MTVTLRQLNVFVQTAKQESISRAAQQCYITQAAASMSLRELEEALGVQLFDRIGRRLKINSNGLALLTQATAILDQTNELTETFKAAANEMRGIIRVGASTTIGNYVLPGLLKQFKQAYPLVDFNIVISNTEHIVQEVEALNVDFGLIEGRCYSDHVEACKWLKDELNIFCDRKHSLAHKQQLSFQELAEQKWIMRETGSGTYDLFMQAVSKHFNVNTELRLESSEAIKRFVLGSDYFACLSNKVIEDYVQLKQLVVVNVPESISLQRYFQYLQHKNKYQTELVKIFLKFIDVEAMRDQ